MKSRLIAVVSCAMALVFTANAQGTKRSNPKLTMEQAWAIASKRESGSVKSSELEREHGKLVYSFDIQTTSGIREVQVDAMTGTIVEDKAESPADEAKEAAKDGKNTTRQSDRKQN